VTFTAAGTNTYLLGGLKGSDNVALGANSIQVGANDENTSFQGVLSGTGGLIKEGSGTLTLAGDNLYTGPTAVNEGRLTINGNQTLSTGAITVASGATLGGTGTMGGDTSIAGFLDGGAAPATVGTLTFAGATTDLTLQSGSTWLVDVVQGAIDNSDTVNVGGALSIDANAMLSVAFAGTFTPHSVYTIANYGSLSGTFNGLAEGAFVDAGMKYFINYGGGTNGSITLTAVPEPGTLGFLGLAVGGFFLRRHRKKKGARA
jgi:fibronectin-binding autotransporter adhesin